MYSHHFNFILLGILCQTLWRYHNQACQWIIPTFLKEVEYLPVKDIDFYGKKRKIDGQIKHATTDNSDEPSEVEIIASDMERSVKVGTQSTESKLVVLFNNLSAGGTKPGVLSMVHICSVPKMDGNGGPIIIHFWKVFNITPKVD